MNICIQIALSCIVIPFMILLPAVLWISLVCPVYSSHRWDVIICAIIGIIMSIGEFVIFGIMLYSIWSHL